MVAPPTDAIEQAATLIATLRDDVARLAERLERGWQIIDSREDAGFDTTELEAHFEALLAEYELACDRLRAMVD